MRASKREGMFFADTHVELMVSWPPSWAAIWLILTMNRVQILLLQFLKNILSSLNVPSCSLLVCFTHFFMNDTNENGKLASLRVQCQDGLHQLDATRHSGASHNVLGVLPTPTGTRLWRAGPAFSVLVSCEN